MFVPLTPLRCLHRAVDLFGSRIGVVPGDRQFTYAELGQRAEQLATGLRKLGIAAGDRVAYLSSMVITGELIQPAGRPMSAAMSGPWLHTGGMAVWDENGFIQILDRKKQIIISGGENISSLEVEAAIFAHPAVLECVVVAAQNPKWGEVPAFKRPRMVEFTSDPLPQTGTGKIRKNELRERFWAGSESAKRVQG